MDGGSDFGGAAGFGPVADNSSHIAKCVGDRAADLLISAARHIGYSGACSASRAHCPAKRRQRSNIVLDINRHKI